MNDLQFNYLWWKLCHIVFQFLVCILIYILLFNLYQENTYYRFDNINFIWLTLLLSYVDWLIWRMPLQSIFLCIVLFGLILLFWENKKNHQIISKNIKEQWNNMIIAYK